MNWTFTTEEIAGQADSWLAFHGGDMAFDDVLRGAELREHEVLDRSVFVYGEGRRSKCLQAQADIEFVRPAGVQVAYFWKKPPLWWRVWDWARERY